MHVVGIRDAFGNQPYPGCHDVLVGSLDQLIEFPECPSAISWVTHTVVDGVVFPLEEPRMVGWAVPRFPPGSIKR
jgi:hypothetical protein